MTVELHDNYSDIITFTRASSGSYLDSDGLLKTASSNVPRVEYDADGNRLGLLIESARTNLITHSNDFTNSSWGADTQNTTITSNFATSVDGATNADRVVSSSTSWNFRTSHSLTAAPYTFSVWVKSNTGSNQNFGLYFSGASNPSGDYVATSQWQRFVLTGTVTTTSSGVGLFNGSSGQTVDLLVYGAQLELSEFATSYIQTSGSTATRSADVASISTSSFGYNDREGTLFVHLGDINFGSSGFPRVVEIGNSSNNGERILFYVSASAGNYAFDVRASGVSQASTTLSGGNSSPFGPAKSALAFRNNDVAAVIDGGDVVTDTSANVTGTTYERNLIKFGGGTTNANDQLNGHLLSVKYYPRRLTNTQIKRLTQ